MTFEVKIDAISALTIKKAMKNAQIRGSVRFSLIISNYEFRMIF